MRTFSKQLIIFFILAITATGYCQEPTQTPKPNKPLQIWLLRSDGVVQIVPTPLPDKVVIDLPGLPEDATPLIMVRVPAGSFLMGRYPAEQQSTSYEDPQHQVTPPSDFYLSKTEITKAQWQAVMGTTPWSGQGYILEEPDSPAVYVSWDDAQDFIEALNQLDQGTFRLPSEAEWEYACRAGHTTRFYWGDDLAGNQVGDYAWYRSNTWDIYEYYAHIVGQKLANDWNLYDMSGNVWEWCEDDWHNSYIDAPANGSAWVDSPRGLYRVIRGGQWDYQAQYLRSANRNHNPPNSRAHGIGFRLASATLNQSPTPTPTPTSPPQNKSFTVISPNGGESWQIGNYNIVKWTINEPNTRFIKIQVLYGPAGDWDNSTHVTTYDWISSTATSYRWYIDPAVFEARDDYWINVAWMTGLPDISQDWSDHVFSLITPGPYWYEDYDFASRGVTAYWPLDGNANDVSGNNHHGTPYNIEYLSGAFSQGVYTKGEEGSYVNLGDVDLAGDFTISLWISLAETLALGQDVAFVNKRYLTSNLDQNYYVGLMPDGTQRPRALYQGAEVSAISQVNPGELYHITYVREGGQQRIYVNGDLEGVGSITTADSLNDADATIGGIYDQNGIHAAYNGITDDVVFFGHALTPGQIQLLFRDQDENGVADFWEFQTPDEVRINWNQLDGSGPPARTDHAMVYDSFRNVTVLYAGTSTTAKNDTWEFDGSNWTQISTSANPGLASQHAMAYDPTRGKTIFFQGNRTPATWEYEGTNWTAVSTTQIPNCISSSRMVYFPPLGKVVLFGGSESGIPLNATWTYDGNAWTQIFPSGNPPALTRHGMGYDSSRQVLVVFGGFTSEGAQADTWEFDGAEWKQVITSSSPPGGCCKAMTYDTDLDRIVLCTGGTYQNWHNQTWVYDGINWEQIDTTTQPSARYEAEMVYDSENQMLVYFGGFNGSHQGDTWLSDDNFSLSPIESKIVFTQSSP